MRRMLAVGLVALIGLAGCGQADDQAEVSAGTTTTVSSTTTTTADGVRVDTDPTTTTAEPAGYAEKKADLKLRGKVRDVLQDFWDEYEFLAEAFGDTEGITEDDIDKALYDACVVKDPEADEKAMGALVLFASETLREHGKDAAGVSVDIRKTNEKVADLADC